MTISSSSTIILSYLFIILVTPLTIESARNSGINVLGIIISNYPQNTSDIAIKTAPEIIEKLGKVKILGILPNIPELIKSDTINSNILIEYVRQNINTQALFGANLN